MECSLTTLLSSVNNGLLASQKGFGESDTSGSGSFGQILASLSGIGPNEGQGGETTMTGRVLPPLFAEPEALRASIDQVLPGLLKLLQTGNDLTVDIDSMAGLQETSATEQSVDAGKPQDHGRLLVDVFSQLINKLTSCVNKAKQPEEVVQEDAPSDTPVLEEGQTTVPNTITVDKQAVIGEEIAARQPVGDGRRTGASTGQDINANAAIAFLLLGALARMNDKSRVSPTDTPQPEGEAEDANSGQSISGKIRFAPHESDTEHTQQDGLAFGSTVAEKDRGSEERQADTSRVTTCDALAGQTSVSLNQSIIPQLIPSNSSDVTSDEDGDNAPFVARTAGDDRLSEQAAQDPTSISSGPLLERSPSVGTSREFLNQLIATLEEMVDGQSDKDEPMRSQSPDSRMSQTKSESGLFVLKGTVRQTAHGLSEPAVVLARESNAPVALPVDGPQEPVAKETSQTTRNPEAIVKEATLTTKNTSHFAPQSGSPVAVERTTSNSTANAGKIGQTTATVDVSGEANVLAQEEHDDGSSRSDTSDKGQSRSEHHGTQAPDQSVLERSGNGQKTASIGHSVSTAAVDRFEKVMLQAANRSGGQDLTVKLDVGNDETVTVAMKDLGETISVEVKASHQGLISLLQSEKETILRHLEGRDLRTSIYIDPNASGSQEKRERRETRRGRFVLTSKKDRGFDSLLEVLA